MALLKMDGFDYYDPNDSGGRIGNLTSGIGVGPGRDGIGQSIMATGSAVTRFFDVQLPGVNPEFFIGFSLNLSGLPSSNDEELFIVSYNSDEHFYGYLTTTGAITLRRTTNTSTTHGTSTIPIPQDQWVTLEIGGLIGNSSTGNIQIRLNGAPMPGLENISGDTLNGSIAIPNVIRLFAGSGGEVRMYDNLYFCDAAGPAPFNTFLGEKRIYTRFPDADSAPNDMTAVGAGTLKADRVSENPSDGDTTYLTSDTVGHKENFTYPDLPSEVTEVSAVQVISQLRKDGAGTRLVKNAVYGSTGTEVLGVDHGLGDQYSYGTDIVENDPDTGVEWTVAAANAIETGVEITG